MTGARKVIVKEPILLEEEADRNAEGNDKSEFPYEQEALDNEGAPVKDENDDEPEFEGVRPGDDEVPEGDLQFDGDEPEAEPLLLTLVSGTLVLHVSRAVLGTTESRPVTVRGVTSATSPTKTEHLGDHPAP